LCAISRNYYSVNRNNPSALSGVAFKGSHLVIPGEGYPIIEKPERRETDGDGSVASPGCVKMRVDPSLGRSVVALLRTCHLFRCLL
jgi:hypothetical protein